MSEHLFPARGLPVLAENILANEALRRMCEFALQDTDYVVGKANTESKPINSAVSAKGSLSYPDLGYEVQIFVKPIPRSNHPTNRTILSDPTSEEGLKELAELKSKIEAEKADIEDAKQDEVADTLSEQALKEDLKDE